MIPIFDQNQKSNSNTTATYIDLSTDDVLMTDHTENSLTEISQLKMNFQPQNCQQVSEQIVEEKEENKDAGE